MVRQHATQPPRLRVVKPQPAELPILDLAEGVQVYRDLLNQGRQLEAIKDDLRGRILRAMDRAGIEDFRTNGVEAIRQVRHFPAQLNQGEAEKILQREGRLKEAEKTVIDPEKAKEILDQLYVQGKIGKGQLPYTEPREVEALIVQEPRS